MFLPTQRQGASSVTSYSVRTDGSSRAHRLYEKAKRNLLDVNGWQKLAGPATAEFKVTDPHGTETAASATEGSYLRISLPIVHGSAAGAGYDWVKVESITKEKRAGYECIAMMVRPSVPPFYNGQQVAHFFSNDATSTFYLERSKNKVKAAVFGRNEKPNTAGVSQFFNKVRNMIVAIGAMFGFNKPQWYSLIKGWLREAEKTGT